MNAENPYAPPAVAETQSSSSRYWHLDGTGILVKNGTTLPEIDLESGISGDEEKLKPLRRVFQTVSPGSFLYFIGAYLLVFGSILYFEIQGAGVFLIFFAGLFLARRLKALRGNKPGVVVFWTFTEERRARRAAIRRWIRLGAMLLLIGGLLVSSTTISGGAAYGFLQIYYIWLGLMVALAIWSLLDRTKYKIRAAESGWVSVTPVHPKALEFLSTLEAADLRKHPGDGSTTKRRIRTVYLYRFPLRMLIGRFHRNPLMILQIALMKLFRSRLLVREAYHFSETEDRTLEHLSPPLREACEAWLSTHPGWMFVSGDHLPSPAGDLFVETGHLASPGLDHCLRVTRAWMLHTPQKSNNQFTFLTWIDDGSQHIFTCDQPFLALKSPHLHHLAKGAPEAVYQAHLGNIAGFPIHQPRDVAELQRLILIDKEESDRLLVERKLQSEVRETES